MASSELLAKVRFLARKNDLDLSNYTDREILLRERNALREGKTRAEFANELLAEVSTNQRQGFSQCPSCGQNTLIHEDGCMHCRSCGWSACG